jgi:hypothetical protein
VARLDAKELFANLAEKEKVKGHHSPEGRAIRMLSRALSGWSTGNLSRGDVIVLCAQALEDWLKARLGRSAWLPGTITLLLRDALSHKVITRAEAIRLQGIHRLRAGCQSGKVSQRQVEATLEFSIQLVEKRW